MAISINIISRLNGVGLNQDVKLLESALSKMGYSVHFSEHKGLRSTWRILKQARQYDANIFIERVFISWLGLAKTNFLIPNQERFPKRQRYKLRGIDTVLCKTKHAYDIFNPIAKHVVYLGFTSHDTYQKNIAKRFDWFFHLAGKSALKGTRDILTLWKKHPEWPQLTLVQHPDHAPESVPENVRLIAESLPEQALRTLQNQHGVHLCLSRSEGWGHYIAEAMSCAAVVLTTDGPPMNELVSDERGILVATDRSESRHLGTNYYVAQSALETTINKVLQLKIEEKKKLGSAAREWFLKNDQQFSARISSVINGEVSPPPC